jgi:outer membrane protein W
LLAITKLTTNMKKHLFASFMLVAILGQANVIAQEKGDFRVGVTGALGTQSSVSGSSDAGLGLTFTGDYFVTDAIDISLGYTFFFKSSASLPSSEVSLESGTVDLDGKYYFLNESVGVYGLFGLSLGFATITTTIDFGNGPTVFPVSDSKFAMNMGAGADYYLGDKLFLNGQAKYNFALEQVVFNLGVGFNMD